MRNSTKKIMVLLAASVLAFGVVGCSDVVTGADYDKDKSTEDTAKQDPTGPYVPPEVSGKLGEAPQITPGSGKPPSELDVKVIAEGDGEEVQPGDTVTVQYSGQLWDGTPFDSSWERGEPATFPLDGVIAGWTQGIPGHKVGDRLLMVIPPDMGYGPAGNPPTIPGNATLVFVVDIVERQAS